MEASDWRRLGWDLTELILSLLPLRSLLRAAAVCRQWRAVAASPGFAALRRCRRPWLFLHGHHNLLPLLKNQAFAFDPDAGDWAPVALPAGFLHEPVAGAAGFLIAAAAAAPSRLAFTPLLCAGQWRETAPLACPRCSPLVGVFFPPSAAGDDRRRPCFVVVGGARYVGGLVDIGDRPPVELYDPAADAWELGPPLPPDFGPGSSSQWLSAALLAGAGAGSGGGLFFVFGIYSCVVAAFDLGRRVWTGARTLRPPGVLFAFLVAAGDDRLVLAGLRSSPGRPLLSFAVWAVDHRTTEYAEVGEMPPELLAGLLDTGAAADDEDHASLKCVGLDGLIYVFNDDHHKGYPACVCEVGDDAAASGLGLRCTWRRVPPLPGPVNQFHKVIAFCSPVHLHSMLEAE